MSFSKRHMLKTAHSVLLAHLDGSDEDALRGVVGGLTLTLDESGVEALKTLLDHTLQEE